MCGFVYKCVCVCVCVCRTIGKVQRDTHSGRDPQPRPIDLSHSTENRNRERVNQSAAAVDLSLCPITPKTSHNAVPCMGRVPTRVPIRLSFYH